MKDPGSVILEMQLTEKGTRLKELGKYLFRVAPGCNKPDVKRAVEKLFKVHVVKVNVMNYFGKMRRQRTANFGRTADWKRAVVTLRDGDKIDLT